MYVIAQIIFYKVYQKPIILKCNNPSYQRNSILSIKYSTNTHALKFYLTPQNFYLFNYFHFIGLSQWC